MSTSKARENLRVDSESDSKPEVGAKLIYTGHRSQAPTKLSVTWSHLKGREAMIVTLQYYLSTRKMVTVTVTVTMTMTLILHAPIILCFISYLLYFSKIYLYLIALTSLAYPWIMHVFC